MANTEVVNSDDINPDDIPFEKLQYDDRYHEQTAKGAIESLAHIVTEAGTNEDEAIFRRSQRDNVPDVGRITFEYDPETERLTVTGDGTGMTAEEMRSRLLHVGVETQEGSRRGFFHRGIREVFVAMGGGEFTSIGKNANGDEVLSKAMFDPKKGMGFLLKDIAPSKANREGLGLEGTGTRVSIPVSRLRKQGPRQFEFGQMEAQIQDCVGLRTLLLDGDRQIELIYAGQPARRLSFEYPAGDVLVARKAVEIGGEQAEVWVGLSPEKLKSGRGVAKQSRHSGLLVRGERAAYEVSVGEKLANHPAMGRIYGEIRIDSIEQLQRAADKTDDEAQLIYKPDRSGLNPSHPLSEAIQGFIDDTLAPMINEIDTEDEKKVTKDMRRELNKLARTINDVVKEDMAEMLGPEPGEKTPEDLPKGEPPEQEPPAPPEKLKRVLESPIDFARRSVFLDASGQRTVQAWFDPEKIPEGTPVSVGKEADGPLKTVVLASDTVPSPDADGVASLNLTLMAGDAEGRHEVTVEAGGFEQVLAVHVRYPRASGFISNIVPVDTDWEAGSAFYNPSNGVVEVFVGRPEFRDAEARAKKRGDKDPLDSPEYRTLIVESVKEAALWAAAELHAEVAWDELPREERSNPKKWAEEVRFSFQELDYRLRANLLKVFLSK